MTFFYPVGYPGWKLVGRLGAPLVFRLVVLRDEEAGVYVATSPDVRGLVAEAATIEALLEEVRAGAQDLIADVLHGAPKSSPLVAWDGAICPA